MKKGKGELLKKPPQPELKQLLILLITITTEIIRASTHIAFTIYQILHKIDSFM